MNINPIIWMMSMKLSTCCRALRKIDRWARGGLLLTLINVGETLRSLWAAGTGITEVMHW
jgi:hypothetical protein